MADCATSAERACAKRVDPGPIPAVLNGSKLDLFSLYREVVARGGFKVGNGINWKGQIFPRMKNYTENNKMTGVGNALKKHYRCELTVVLLGDTHCVSLRDRSQDHVPGAYCA